MSVESILEIDASYFVGKETDIDSKYRDGGMIRVIRTRVKYLIEGTRRQ